MVAVDSSRAATSQSQTPARGGITDDAKLAWPVILLVVALVTPFILQLGPLRLPLYRFVLLIFFFPCLFQLLSGRVGKLIVPDFCVLFIGFWVTLSLIFHHGIAEMVEAIGIYQAETLGAYLFGRCYIRSSRAFFKLVRLCFIIILIMLPFALYEAVTGTNMILKIFDAIGRTYFDVWKQRRLGLDRVQGPFSHPILFGVFFGGLVGVTYYVLGYHLSRFGRTISTGIVGLTGALALSSGPLTALVAQVGFIVWDGLLKKVKSRWYILIGLVITAYIGIDLLSNRNPFQVFVYYLSFNAHTAYNRILIFEWGTKNIFDNPIFGIGYNPWEKLSWMTTSFDMFWLVPAMQHGVPVWIAWNLMFFWPFIKIARMNLPNPKISAYRIGYLSSLFGLYMSGWTVHYWDATYIFLIFLMTSGYWFLDRGTAEDEAIDLTAPQKEDGVRYTRFRTAERPPSVRERASVARDGNKRPRSTRFEASDP